MAQFNNTPDLGNQAFAALYGFFTKDMASFVQVPNNSFGWPTTEALEASVPTVSKDTEKITIGRQDVTAPLFMTGVPAKKVLAEVAVWVDQVGTKADNDEEEFCHHFLRKMSEANRITDFREGVCRLFHAKAGEEPCWTNVYDTAALDNRRLSLSMVPPEEAAEDEAEIQEQGPV